MKGVLLRPLTKKTHINYGMKETDIGYVKVFWCKRFILNNKEKLHKFNSKADEGTIIRYSTTNKAYRVYNIKLVAKKYTYSI